MTRDDVINQMQPTFKKIFSNPNLIIGPESNASNVDKWDSMNNIRLVAALEKEFRCKFSFKELHRLQNVGGLADLILQKLQSAH